MGNKKGSLNLMMIYTSMTLAKLESLFLSQRNPEDFPPNSDYRRCLGYDPLFLHIEVDSAGRETNRTVCLMDETLVDSLRESGILARFGNINISTYRLDSKYPRHDLSYNMEIVIPHGIKPEEAKEIVQQRIAYLADVWEFYLTQDGRVCPPSVTLYGTHITINFSDLTHTDDIVATMVLFSAAPWCLMTPTLSFEPPHFLAKWVKKRTSYNEERYYPSIFSRGRRE